MYESPREAYIGELSRLLDFGHKAGAIHDVASPASEFGSNPQTSIEIFADTFQIADPKSSIISTAVRPFNLQYGVGLLLWTLAGSENSDWITYYRGKRPRQKKAAFGHRLFRNGGSVDQCKISLERILSDPGTRRAYMPIFSIMDHVNPEGEIPCAAGFHLFLREGSLHGVTMMRAQNALASLPMDLFVFCSLLSYLAASIKVPVGTYSHMSSTFHIFQSQQGEAAQLIRESSSVVGMSLGSFSAFPEELRYLLEFERRIRIAVAQDDQAVLRQLSRNPSTDYRSEVGVKLHRLVVAIAARKLGCEDILQSLALPKELVMLL